MQSKTYGDSDHATTRSCWPLPLFEQDSLAQQKVGLSVWVGFERHSLEPKCTSAIQNLIGQWSRNHGHLLTIPYAWARFTRPTKSWSSSVGKFRQTLIRTNMYECNKKTYGDSDHATTRICWYLHVGSDGVYRRTRSIACFMLIKHLNKTKMNKHMCS